ncbi:unnamed protein product [Oppiella nova]|uniref:Lipocalin/cytosolic fatty-acid binding domain-containing protein n=1 Tax=Oppiella nova TaxID=334625 RepID=A0A7R9QFM5_9ACAR|nr:unnamed protein product [Oppiella nova]CAG2164391.1 unnamed protein product [Oppiella nova]
MWSKVVVSIVIVLPMVCQLSAPLQLRAGQCPRIKPKANFDLNKFMGEWYVIYRDGSEGADCIRQNVTSNGRNRYFITEIREPLAKGVFT